MKNRRFGFRWLAVMVTALTLSLLVYGATASEVAHAGLRWSGID